MTSPNNASSFLGVNFFCDMTDEERAGMNGLLLPEDEEVNDSGPPMIGGFGNPFG